MTGFNKMQASVAKPQYRFNKGLWLFRKEEAYEATIKELSENLLNRGAIEMVQNPTKRIYKMSMLYLMFIKRKRTGLIKSCGVADGRSQGEYITKDKLSLPTVATNALFAICVLIAAHGRQTTVVDIPGVFLQSNYPKDKERYIQFTCIMVNIIIKIRPEYKQFVMKTKFGLKCLIGKLLKGVYGTVTYLWLSYSIQNEELSQDNWF